MPIENGTVYLKPILRFSWVTQTKFCEKDQNKFRHENSDKNITTKPRLSDGIDRNWHF